MPGRPLSRRTTLGSALGSALAAPLVLAACDIDPPVRQQESSPETPPPPEDSELVVTVVTALLRAQAVLVATTTAVPSLGSRLEPVGTAHAAHLEVLVGAVPEADLASPAPVSAPTRILPALAAVRRSEQRLLREVRTGCLTAASGDLARVLASIAASTSQHSAALATEVTS